jgi:hypothetical protein
MTLLNTFIEWFTNHRLMGEMLAIGIFVILVGTWIVISYLNYKKEEAKKEAARNAAKTKKRI